MIETTPNWNKFIQVVIDKEICASIGIISKPLSSKNSISEIRRISKIKQKNNFPVIEFWNHGYDHSKNGNKTEFYGTDFNYQLSHIQKSQDFFIDSSCFIVPPVLMLVIIIFDSSSTSVFSLGEPPNFKK